MRRVLLLLLPTFSEFEITVAIAVLRDSHRLLTEAVAPGEVAGEAGLRCLPDLAVAEIDPAAHDGILIPGGDMVHLRDGAPVFALAEAMADAGKVVAAISAGPYVLGRAGLLTNRPYTVGYARTQRDVLGCFDERGFRDEPLVEAGPILTAQGHAYVAFGLRVGERLGADVDRDVRDFDQGRRNPWMKP